MRPMLGPMLKQMFGGNMERMLGQMLVLRATSYTMRRITQCWQQIFGSDHSSLPTLETPFDLGQKKQQAAEYIPTQTFDVYHS